MDQAKIHPEPGQRIICIHQQFGTLVTPMEVCPLEQFPEIEGCGKEAVGDGMPMGTREMVRRRQ